LLGKNANLYYAAGIANAAAKTHEVWVVIPDYSDKSIFSKDVNILTITAPPSILGTIRNIFSSQHRIILEKIKNVQPDILHVVWNHPYAVYYAKMLRNFKIYWTCHDPEFHSGEAWKLRTLGDRYVHTYFFKHADRIFVHGKKLKKQLIENKNISASRIMSKRHGAIGPALKEGQNKKIPDKGVFLFFGRIERYKGLFTLLNAMQSVVKKFPKSKLIIAGSGSLKEYEALIEQVKGNLEIHNEFISDKKLAVLFSKSEFVVLPYDDATQSGVIPVAYSFRKPVIATDVGSLSDVVINEKTGILVPPKNSEKLSEAISRFLLNPNITKNMGKKAYLWMKENLDWGKIIKDMY